MDFHFSAIFVNLSLLVFTIPVESPQSPDERAILADREPVSGRLEIDSALGLVFRPTDGGPPLPVRTTRKVEHAGPRQIAPGTSPAHRLFFWGNESLSGTIQSIDGETVQLKTPAGDVLPVPVYLISKIEHFQGNAVILREEFEDESTADLAGLPCVLRGYRLVRCSRSDDRTGATPVAGGATFESRPRIRHRAAPG